MNRLIFLGLAVTVLFALPSLSFAGRGEQSDDRIPIDNIPSISSVFGIP